MQRTCHIHCIGMAFLACDSSHGQPADPYLQTASHNDCIKRFLLFFTEFKLRERSDIN